MTIKHVVSMSGGKDSQATAHMAIESVDPVVPLEHLELWVADTGNELKLTYDHWDYLDTVMPKKLRRLKADFTQQIAGKRKYVEEKWAEKGVPASAIERALKVLHPTGNPYLDLCLWKGRFPSRKAQFCTRHLKIEPLVNAQIELIDQGYAVWSWQGVRRDESDQRQYAKTFEEVGGGLYIYRPIVRWKAEDTFEAMRVGGTKPNPLYSMGMNRVGCVCINARKEEIREMAARFPEEFDRIEEWEALVGLASKRGVSSFYPNPEREAHLHKHGIRNVIEWSKTGRGGLQYDFLKANVMDEDVHKCTSSYGLCE